MLLLLLFVVGLVTHERLISRSMALVSFATFRTMLVLMIVKSLIGDSERLSFCCVGC